MPRYTGDRPKYSGRMAPEIKSVARATLTPVQVVEAFSSAMDTMFPPLPGTIAGLRDALGGTSKAAKAIDVTPRSIQRYIAAEEMRHSQTRRADIATRGEIVRKLQNALAPQLRGAREAAMIRDGVEMIAAGALNFRGYVSGRFIHWHIPGDAWRSILDAWKQEKAKIATARFQRAFGRSYGGQKTGKVEVFWTFLAELTFIPPNH